MTPEEMDRLMDEHFEYEQRDDVEGVLRTLDDEVVHDVVGWPPGVSQGPEQVRPFYERLFADLQETRIRTLRRLYGPDFAVDESIAESIAAGAPFGLEGRGRRITFRLLHVFEFKEGRISRENVWLDLAAIQQQLAPVESAAETTPRAR